MVGEQSRVGRQQGSYGKKRKFNWAANMDFLISPTNYMLGFLGQGAMHLLAIPGNHRIYLWRLACWHARGLPLPRLCDLLDFTSQICHRVEMTETLLHKTQRHSSCNVVLEISCMKAEMWLMMWLAAQRHHEQAPPAEFTQDSQTIYTSHTLVLRSICRDNAKYGS